MKQRTLLSFHNVSIELPAGKLFENLSFSVQTGEVVALIGPNGCGKTTILNLITSHRSDENKPTANSEISLRGNIHLMDRTEVVYLPQVLQTECGFASILTGSGLDSSAREMKLRRDFALNETDSDLGALSDGELQKRAIIRAILEDGDLYLFDEPTNYLDLYGVVAFEQHVNRLKSGGKGVVLVTHDRALADNLADRTVLLTRHGIYHSMGGADNAWSVRAEDIRARSERAREITRKIRRLQDDVQRRAGWAAKKEKQKIGAGRAKAHISRLSAKMAKRAKAVQKRAGSELEKLHRTKPFVPKLLNLRFTDYEVRNRQVFSLEEVSFRYPVALDYTPDDHDSWLLEKICFSATTHDKVCVMGANGSGKSTILKLITQRFRSSKGSCYINSGVRMVYVPQGLEGFFKNERLLDNFCDCSCDEATVRKHLGSALIRRDKVHEPVDNFSCGELMRAAVVKCILTQAEFLLLDEPTSHLDIESIEILEHLLGRFNGGFVLISHDRAFVGNVAEILYVLQDKKLVLQ